MNILITSFVCINLVHSCPIGCAIRDGQKNVIVSVEDKAIVNLNYPKHQASDQWEQWKKDNPSYDKQSCIILGANYRPIDKTFRVRVQVGQVSGDIPAFWLTVDPKWQYNQSNTIDLKLNIDQLDGHVDGTDSSEDGLSASASDLEELTHGTQFASTIMDLDAQYDYFHQTHSASTQIGQMDGKIDELLVNDQLIAPVNQLIKLTNNGLHENKSDIVRQCETVSNLIQSGATLIPIDDNDKKKINKKSKKQQHCDKSGVNITVNSLF